MGSDSGSAKEFVEKLGEIASRSKVTYIDHHYVSEAVKKRIRRKGVKLVHDVRECASILTYQTFRSGLPDDAKMLALWGAVTDYMDDSPAARRLMEQTERHFVLLEATMLAYALAKKGEEAGFPEMVAKELSMMKLPHEVDGVPTLALEQLKEVVRLQDEVKRDGKRIGRLAYMQTDQQSTGGVAKLLIGAFGVPVGVSFKERDGGWYEASLRCTSQCKVHLGKTISSIAEGLGGKGGGHGKAAGCRIPASRVQDMLRALSRRV
jgi:RecJ-like exonuclease